MSGGYFDYAQHRIQDVVDKLEEYLDGREVSKEDIKYLEREGLEPDELAYLKKHKRTMPNRYGFRDEVVEKFRTGLKILKEAAIYAERIDYLLEDDDGEDEFLSRLNKELEQLNNSN